MPATMPVRILLAAACLAGLPLPAWAGPTLQLHASARADVPNDEMVVTLAAERRGAEVGPLNREVLAQLNAAIRDAKATPKVDARLGGIYTQPDWADGKQRGWQVRGEVVLESADMEALSVLAGRLARSLQLAGVHFRVSAARRTDEENALLRQAAQHFRSKAEAAAKAFGFTDYTLRDLVLQPRDPMPPVQPMMNARTASAEMASVPAEGGRSEVWVTVSGTVELK